MKNLSDANQFVSKSKEEIVELIEKLKEIRIPLQEKSDYVEKLIDELECLHTNLIEGLANLDNSISSLQYKDFD